MRYERDWIKRKGWPVQGWNENKFRNQQAFHPHKLRGPVRESGHVEDRRSEPRNFLPLDSGTTEWGWTGRDISLFPGVLNQ